MHFSDLIYSPRVLNKIMTSHQEKFKKKKKKKQTLGALVKEINLKILLYIKIYILKI